MKKVLLALILALTFAPVAALADDPNPPAPPTDAQRQAMFQTMETFHAKTEQMHQQMRAQILGSLTPAHRQAVANVIGQLAVSSNPDPRAAARQLDAILSQGEQQRILATHTSFKAQMKALHEQLRAQMERQMPNPPPGAERMHKFGPMGMHHEQEPTDAGSILLRTLGGGMHEENRFFIGAPHP